MKSIIVILALMAFRGSISAFANSRVSVEPDGGYSGVVIRIRDDVQEEKCAQIIRNLQVRERIKGIPFPLFVRSFFPTSCLVVAHSDSPRSSLSLLALHIFFAPFSEFSLSLTSCP